MGPENRRTLLRLQQSVVSPLLPFSLLPSLETEFKVEYLLEEVICSLCLHKEASLSSSSSPPLSPTLALSLMLPVFPHPEKIFRSDHMLTQAFT